MGSYRNFLASRVADPFLWSVVKRLPTLDQLREWDERQWDGADALSSRQGASLADLLAHALTRVPFYSKRVGEVGLDDLASRPFDVLSEFPVLEKADLSGHADELTCELGRGDYWNLSGGSTGEPVRFLQDRVFASASLATTMLFYEWAGFERGGPHIRLWGASRDLGSGSVALRRRAADWIFNRITLDAFDMSERTMRRYAGIISARRPVCLEGYIDGLHELALYVEREGLEVGRPGTIVSSAGTLFPNMRETIERVFGAPVFDRYGTREVGNVAAECDRHEGLHVFGETSVVEVVGADGRPVGEGEEGELLVTNLWNYTMPLIRYRIGDRAVRGSAPCSCGRPYPLLARIAGRSEACVRLRSGGVVLPEFFIHVIGVENNDGSIRKFQVVQEDWDTIDVRVVAAEGARDRVLAREGDIRSRIRQMLGECTVTLSLVDRIDPTPTGKHNYVVSRVDRESE